MKMRHFFLLTLIFIGEVGVTAPAGDLRGRVEHVMDRLAFGARPGDVDEIVNQGERGLQKWIASQLNPDKIDDRNLEAILAKHEVLKMSVEELTEHFNKEGAEDDPQKKPDEIRKAWASAKLIRAVLSRRQFEERLVDFWYNHFNVDQRKGKDRWFFGPYERDAIRPHLFGSFYEMLRATARHPAMLFYLDNFLSQSAQLDPKANKGLNENYARELLELHTLGVQAGYTQNDVKEVARVLTGWSIADLNNSPTFKFKEKLHDTGEKKLLSWDFKAGGTEDEGERLLKMLSTHPATARHLATQLVESFVVNPAPPPLVARLSQNFLRTGGNLKTLYQDLLDSKEFWDVKNRKALVKDHFVWTVSAIRILGGEVIWKNQLINELNNLGEPLYQCAPPTGYRMRVEDFINSGSLIERLNLSLRLAANRVDGVYSNSLGMKTRKFSNQEDFIRSLRDLVGLPKLSDSTLLALRSELSDETWSLSASLPRPYIFARLLGILLASPEFQRM